MSHPLQPRLGPRFLVCAALGIGVLAWQSAAIDPVAAQPPAAKTDAKPGAKPDGAKPDLADQKFQAATAATGAKDVPGDPSSLAAKAADSPAGTDTGWFSVASWWAGLLFKGGPLMIPIGLLSLMAVAFTIERFFGLRRARVIPRRFVREMRGLAAAPGGFDPRKAYRLCQQFPSSAANVVRALLLKAGRSVPEIENAVKEGLERENWRLNFNVRPLLLAVTAAPLLGLLGTVCGMIIAFFRTANAPVGADRALVLADGIYLKLITTMGGLGVAIPALLAAFYFEGRIQSLLREIEDLTHSILPQVEKFEGKLKTGRPSPSGIEPPPIAKFAPLESMSVELASHLGQE